MFRLSLLFLTFLFYSTFAIAAIEHPDEYADNIINRVKSHRCTIYEQMNLTEEQLEEIEELDRKYYIQAKSDLIMIAILSTNLENLAENPDCTTKEIRKIQKDIKYTQKEMNKLKKDYNNKFKSILTWKQKSVYKRILAQKITEWEQECNK